MHQKSILADKEIDEFEYKGTLVLANKYGEIIDSFDIFPDNSNLIDKDGFKIISQEIMGVNTPFIFEKKETATSITNIHFHYYIRWVDESRFDCIMSIPITAKKTATEFQEIYKDKPVDLTKGCKMQSIFYYSNQEVIATITAKEDTDKNLFFNIESFDIKIPLNDVKAGLPKISYPQLSSKFIQNLWFRLELAISSFSKERFGPYFPSEQSLSLRDSHYYIEQEIPIEGISVLSPPKTLETIFPDDVTFSLNYYIRDKTIEDSSIFFLFSDTISLSDIIKRSRGHQKIRERFVVERQIELGVVFLTLHFFVKEEVMPPPVTQEPIGVISSGCWLLERVSIAMKC